MTSASSPGYRSSREWNRTLPDLLVIVPSRGRPDSVQRLWDRMRQTCRGDTRLLVSLDYDDPACALVQIADPGAGK